MKIIEITDYSDERLAPYVRLTEAQLRNSVSPDEGIFIAESPKVIKVALQKGYRPVSMLCEQRHIEGDAAEIISMAGDDVPLFTAERKLLSALTGYTLTRGVLCAMQRPKAASAESVLRDARRVCVIDGVCDTTNIGAIFRSAAALGVDCILLTPSSCDPFNRRSIRVSMGSVFLVPWTNIESVSELKRYGFKTVAMALRHDSILLEDPVLKREPRLAIVMGTEGDGLADMVISSADYVVKIPMRHDVDSLNVAAAAAVAFWELVARP